MAPPQVDSAAIVQTGINPITGSPLSSEQRKALFRRTAAPSSILGQGGALVKRTEDTSSLVVAQTQQITSLQDQLNVLRVEVSTLNNGLASINNIIQRDGILEQQRLRGEQEAERRNAEQQVRIGKENELERKIQSALMVPVIALQKKVTNIFANIFGALTTLFTGWLTNQGIETLKALDQGNKKKLEQIKDTVLKNILYAVGAIAAIKIGFNTIIRSAIGLASRIGGIATRLALAPFRALRNQLTKIPGAVGGLFGGGGRSVMSKATNFFSSVKSRVTGATKAAARRLGGPVVQGTIGTLLDISMGEDPGRALAGAAAGVVGAVPGAAVGSLLGPLGSFAGGVGGYSAASPFGKDLYDKFMGKKETPPTESQASAAQPQAPMMPQSSDLTITQPSSPATSTVPPPSAEMVKNFEMAWQYRNNPMARGRIESAWEKMTPEQKIQAKNWADSTGKNWDDMKLSAPPVSLTSIQSLPTSSQQQMQNIPTQSPNIGNLPEPQPNVVVLPTPQSQRRQSMIGPSSAGSDAPLINSANPDNFYVLYSQLNYNVVM